MTRPIASEYVGDTAETRDQVIARRAASGWRWIGGTSQVLGVPAILVERLDFELVGLASAAARTA